MDHLHVTHITEGLQIVKYRASSICDKYNKNKDTVKYMHTPSIQTHDMYICLHEHKGDKVLKELTTSSLKILSSLKRSYYKLETSNYIGQT